MTNEEIFILELYDEYNSTLEMLREDCENARRVLAVLDEYGEDVSELLAPVMVETNDLRAPLITPKKQKSMGTEKTRAAKSVKMLK